MITYLDKEEYYEKIKYINQSTEGGHWTPGSIERRWDYHSKVVSLIKDIKISSPDEILEIGTMGVKCVHESTTLDFTEKWDFPGKKPDIVHDLRILPWPVKEKQFELLVALRVFQHLAPSQRECFLEATRIAKKIILVVPGEYKNTQIPDSKGMAYQDFVNYLDGIHPNIYAKTAMGDLYYWDLDCKSKINLEVLVVTPQKNKNNI